MSQLYVPDGVFLVCTDGMSKQTLQVTSLSTIKIADGRLAATRNDRMCDNHNCAKMVVAGAIIGALIVGIIAAATVATGGMAGAAIIGACAAGGAVAGAGVGLLAGFIPCICALLTSEWIIYHSKALFEKQEALLEESSIPCFFGGEVLIFYSEEAADAAVALKRADTICNVGIVTITAFAMGLSGAFKGIVTAGKGLFAGFSQFGFSAGMTNLGHMLLRGASSYVGSYFATNLIVNPVKNFIYDKGGWTDAVVPVNTNMVDIMNGEGEDNSYRNPDKIEKEVGKLLGAGNVSNVGLVKPYSIIVEQEYEMYNIVGQGSETTLFEPVTSTDLRSGAIRSNTQATSSPQYDANIRINDRTGYAEGGVRTERTTGTQFNSNWRGAAVDGLTSSFKPKALGKSLLMSALSDLLSAIKNPIVKGYIEDFEKSQEKEAEARESICVLEENV